MNEKNAVTKEYMRQNDRFADICNYYLFGGRQIIRPEDLQERDILKNCVAKTVRGITYLVIGVGNQSEIHYAMLVRNMLYDAIKYEKEGLPMSSEAVQLINTCLNAGLELPEEKEEVKMCKGIDELVARGKAEAEVLKYLQKANEEKNE